ncbi:MAG TPA: nuclear transport factor 2 family protein [Jatrophihabitantaceae bacterium]|jgi:ketosteroid isomerase-like protein
MTSPLAVVERFNAAWDAHDLAAALALISPDCVFESTSPPDGSRAVGTEQIAAAWQPIFDDVSSRFTSEEVFGSGDRIVQLWRYEWTDGHVRGVDVFRLRDGLVCEKLSYVKG